MASTSSAASVTVERGIAILSECLDRKSDLKERAQTLDESEVSALELVIESVIHGNDVVFGLMPPSMEDWSAFDVAMDAAELLAHKTSSASIPLIMRLFREIAEEDEEYLLANGPGLVGSFEPEAAGAWLSNVRATKETCILESVIVDGIGIIAKEHVAIRQELAPQIVQLLASADKSAPELNGQLVGLASDWRLTEAAEIIERAYSQNFVDCGMVGNWETVRRQLGVEGLGLPMPTKPIDSMVAFRTKMGIGLFSNVSLFGELKRK